MWSMSISSIVIFLSYFKRPIRNTDWQGSRAAPGRRGKIVERKAHGYGTSLLVLFLFACLIFLFLSTPCDFSCFFCIRTLDTRVPIILLRSALQYLRMHQRPLIVLGTPRENSRGASTPEFESILAPIQSSDCQPTFRSRKILFQVIIFFKFLKYRKYLAVMGINYC